MTDIHITQEYPHPPCAVWRALTDPQLVPLWTATGRGGRPDGFSAVVGTRFRYVARPLPGWRGYVECEVLEAREPSLLRFTWVGDENGPATEVAYRLTSTAAGTRLDYDHTGFTGLGGLVMAKAVLGPVRRRMLRVGLPALLDGLDGDGNARTGG